MPRLDIEIVNRGLARSRALAQSYIGEGNVLVNGMVIDKASKNINESDEITIQNKLKYVSRGGLKLERALLEFCPNLTTDHNHPIPSPSPKEGSHPDALLPFLWRRGRGMGKDFICLDIGSSTGGFTDCLLQYGATHVTAVDVGSNQLDASLRSDDRITLYENTDIRNLFGILNKENKNIKFNLITIDVSFISLTKIIPYLGVFCFDKEKDIIDQEYKKDKRITKVIALVKPQFEVGKGNSLSDNVYEEVIENIKKCFEQNGFTYVGHIDSPITGGDGNREFLMYVDYSR